MTFDDLPQDWPDRSLDDPVLRGDVIDLCVRDADRACRSIAVLLCDDEHRLLSPVVINDLPIVTSPHDRLDTFQFLLQLPVRVPAVVVALAWPWASVGDHVVGSWRHAAEVMCRRAGMTLIAFHLATMDGVEEAGAAA